MSQPVNSKGDPFRHLSAEELIEELRQYNHHELHLHCTATPSIAVQWAETPNGMYWQTAMRRVHMINRGFIDIAQHVTLLPDGQYITGRSFDQTPASITGYNGSAPNRIPFMVEMFGNFDIGHDLFQGAQKVAALKLVKFFDSQGKYLRFHREHSSKTCPGTSIIKSELLEEARNLEIKEGDINMSRIGTGIVTASVLNVRPEPSTSKPAIGSLPKGTKVDVMKEMSNGWLQIKHPTISGYVSGLYVTWTKDTGQQVNTELQKALETALNENKLLKSKNEKLISGLEQLLKEARA